MDEILELELELFIPRANHAYPNKALKFGLNS